MSEVVERVSSPPLQERLLGTLIVIVLRAKNLPNRVRIGKQNPYATVTYGLHKKRTETIERGGQQPTWDAEFRFEILKDEYSSQQLEQGGAAHVDRKGGVLPMNTKESTTNKLEKPKTTVTVGDTRRILKLACWADDNRDPKLIGEGELNIEETIRKGKFDDWVKLERKDRYAGEVYLELTWYSNEPKPAASTRPERSDSPSRGNYGGAGSRLNDDGDESEGKENEEWEGSNGGSLHHRGSQASIESNGIPYQPSADYPDPDLAPLSGNNYPDADLAPLTRSMSALSVGRPLPQPPISAPPPSSYASALAQSQTYSHFPTNTLPNDGYRDPRERPTSFHSSVGPSGGYPYQQQSAPLHQSQQQQGGYQGYPTAGEFGAYEAQQYQPQYDQPQQQAQLGEFEQLAHQHYANQGYPQTSTASRRPLPQPGPPGPPPPPQGQSYEPHGDSYPSQSPYPPALPQPPVPPIPPSTSAYWQRHQQTASSLPPSSTYPNLPSSSMSYQTLPHSASQQTIQPSPSTPSFAPPPPPPPPQSFAVPPPPPSLSSSYPASQHTSYNPQYAPAPVFSPPPPPPSLQGIPPQSGYPHPPPALPSNYYQQQQPQPIYNQHYETAPYEQGYDPQSNYDQTSYNNDSRPPLPPPPPPTHSTTQQYRQY